MKYKISELANIHKMTPKGIHYYEKLGLIQPPKKDSGFREYRLEDAHAVYWTRYLRSLGFSLEEISDISHAEDFVKTQLHYDERITNLEQEIANKLKLLELVKRQRETLNKVEEYEGKYEVTTRPALYRFATFTSGEKHMSKDTYKLEQLGNEISPFCVGSLLYKSEDLLSRLGTDADAIPTYIGLCITAEDMEQMFETKIQGIGFLPPAKCLYTIVRGPVDPIDDCRRIKPALKHIKSNGLEICGDAVTRMFAQRQVKESIVRWDELWIPVK